MRLSGLFLAAVLLLSPFTFAQHSSGGGGGSGGSSGGSSGGGSHSGSSGGGSYAGSSGGSHSSGGSYSSGASHSASGSSSNGSSSHNGSSRSTGSNMSSRSGERNAISNETRTNHSLNTNSHLRSAAPEKRNFLSILRHPFRRPQTKHAAYVPRPICPKGHCGICPAGEVSMGGGCIGGNVPVYRNNYCFQGQGWVGGSCLAHTTFMADCSSIGLAMQRQEQRMQAAESIRQSACMNVGSQDCSAAQKEWQSEQSLYRTWSDRYSRCQASGWAASRFGGFGPSQYGRGVGFDPLRLNLDY